MWGLIMSYYASTAIGLGICGAVATFLALAPTAQAASTTTFIAQSPCPLDGSGLCSSFFPTDSSKIVRTFEFTAPAAGKAAVTFESSIQCVNDNGTDGDNFGVVDLAGQILGTPTGTVANPGPSYVRIAARIPPLSPNFEDYSFPLLISTTRIISYPSAGKKSVVFKLVANRMDADTSCNILTGSFHIIYTSP
jgi:hypothetical protein